MIVVDALLLWLLGQGGVDEGRELE